MKSLLTKIISMLTIFTLCVGLTACKTTDEKCASGHTWKFTSTTATCLNSGVENYACEVCKTTKTENVEAYGHDLVQSSYTAPTCKTNGEKVEKCSRCGFESKQTLLVVDHDYQVESTIPSSCTVKGSQLLKCSMCHETKTQALELSAHTFELINTIPSTCIVHGSNEFKCKDCMATKEEELPFSNHHYQSQNTATCFSDGQLKNVCPDCQHEEVLEDTAMLSHKFGEDGYCTKCSIYETFFDMDKIDLRYIKFDNSTLKQLEGYLLPKFKIPHKIPLSYLESHVIKICLSLLGTHDQPLESCIGYSPYKDDYMELFISTSTSLEGEKSLVFSIFIGDEPLFSTDNMLNAKEFKLELTWDGYKTAEKTYQIEK